MFAERGSFRPGSASFGCWLRRCEGFGVDSPHVRVGFVEELRYGASVEEPDAIAVRAGLLGRLLLIVPTAEAQEIFPGDERMLLHRSPRLTATESARKRGGRRLGFHRPTGERGIEREGR